MSWAVAGMPWVLLAADRSAAAPASAPTRVARARRCGAGVRRRAGDEFGTLVVAIAFVVWLRRRGRWRCRESTGRVAAAGWHSGSASIGARGGPVRADCCGRLTVPSGHGARAPRSSGRCTRSRCIETVAPKLFGDYSRQPSLATIPWVPVLNSGREPFFFSIYFGVPLLALACFGLVAGGLAAMEPFLAGGRRWLARLRRRQLHADLPGDEPLGPDPVVIPISRQVRDPRLPGGGGERQRRMGRVVAARRAAVAASTIRSRPARDRRPRRCRSGDRRARRRRVPVLRHADGRLAVHARAIAPVGQSDRGGRVHADVAAAARRDRAAGVAGDARSLHRGDQPARHQPGGPPRDGALRAPRARRRRSHRPRVADQSDVRSVASARAGMAGDDDRRLRPPFLCRWQAGRYAGSKRCRWVARLSESARLDWIGQSRRPERTDGPLSVGVAGARDAVVRPCGAVAETISVGDG